ncbi:MAG: septum formation initiator family protein [Chitinophagales bacterium]|nr:septum formation initiator family protein [Chitinophagales bacterium]
MEKIKTIRERIRNWNVPKIFLNKFVFTFFIFMVWMSFFDQNNIIVQLDRRNDLRQAAVQKEFYAEETEKAKLQLSQLLTDKQSLEKFAREKYYMKKPNEDVFVIVEK